MSRLSLAQQLKRLEEEDTPRSVDPEAAYTSLDGLEIPTREGDEGREHYLDVGPSRLRAQREEVGQTLLGDKYAGAKTGRVKIFDDDEEEDEEDEIEEGDDDDEDEGSDASDDEDGDEDEADEDDEEEEEEDGEEQEVQAEAPQPSTVSASKSHRTLDPMRSLREARQKDVEKGKGIRKQKVRIFDISYSTLR